MVETCFGMCNRNHVANHDESSQRNAASRTIARGDSEADLTFSAIPEVLNQFPTQAEIQGFGVSTVRSLSSTKEGRKITILQFSHCENAALDNGSALQQCGNPCYSYKLKRGTLGPYSDSPTDSEKVYGRGEDR